MMAGAHHPLRASAVLGVAIAATAMVVAAATAVRVVLMAFPRSTVEGITLQLRG
jgi:hypothetical protein